MKIERRQFFSALVGGVLAAVEAKAQGWIGKLRDIVMILKELKDFKLPMIEAERNPEFRIVYDTGLDITSPGYGATFFHVGPLDSGKRIPLHCAYKEGKRHLELDVAYVVIESVELIAGARNSPHGFLKVIWSGDYVDPKSNSITGSVKAKCSLAFDGPGQNLGTGQMLFDATGLQQSHYRCGCARLS